ncbi:hypothetical protein E1B28_012502 [Marasmius oreades]|uniref:Uncharacterized protein n=1 Tax=Marasmius oreades TaxID=181124 RepID=A0A9P7UNS0_9AGAR|nr:uncharacterized protein E1B28_012502 [Marasmius oreades]KAG7088518.1 hypothetical protein E1B28_012502 [Marasmius oreades]
MSFAGNIEADAWAPAPQTGDIIAEAMKKERVLKEFIASQADLKALYTRAQTVQKEIDKLTSGNQTLQMYIDNLTVQMAKRR